MRVQYHPDAEIDYKEAFAWYAKQSTRAANRFETAVDDAVEKIKAHPEQFSATHCDCRRCALRPFPVSLIFQPRNNAIFIVAVAHSSRDENYWHHRV